MVFSISPLLYNFQDIVGHHFSVTNLVESFHLLTLHLPLLRASPFLIIIVHPFWRFCGFISLRIFNFPLTQETIISFKTRGGYWIWKMKGLSHQSPSSFIKTHFSVPFVNQFSISVFHLTKLSLFFLLQKREIISEKWTDFQTNSSPPLLKKLLPLESKTSLGLKQHKFVTKSSHNY